VPLKPFPNTGRGYNIHYSFHVCSFLKVLLRINKSILLKPSKIKNFLKEICKISRTIRYKKRNLPTLEICFDFPRAKGQFSPAK